MPRPVNEQVVVVVGASSGVGRNAALKFGRAGASVVLAARNTVALEEVADEIRQMGGQALVVTTDVADWEQVKHLAEQAFSTFGHIDTWVNDAAVSVYATVEETSVEEFNRVMQVNHMGQVHGVKAVLPFMKRQGYGTIVNMGSIESQRSLPMQAAYAASKHAVKGFTEALRMELEREKSNIAVTIILPAGMNTPLFNHARSKMGVKPMPVPPVYKPETASDAIVYTAQHPQRDIYIGGAGMMFSILQRISPALMDRISMAGKMGFRLQQTNEPDDGRDNLYEPMVGPGRVHGDFGSMAKPSIFTRVFELVPMGTRFLFPALVAGGFALVRRAKVWE